MQVRAELAVSAQAVTTVIRGRFWDLSTSTSTVLPAGSVVRVVDQHPIDERRLECLDERVQLDRRAFVFCGLHAHMRLTEALVKEMFGRAIDTGKVAQLQSAFKTHQGMEDKLVRSDKKRGWKKVSFYRYEC